MTSLLFALEDDGDAAPCVSSYEDMLLGTHLRFLLKPNCPYHSQVLLAVQEACASVHQPSGPPAAAEVCSLTAVAQKLAAMGHNVRLRQARGGTAGGGCTKGPFGFFTSLSHRFLVVSTPCEAQQAHPVQEQPDYDVCYTLDCAPPPCYELAHCDMCRGGCGAELIVDPAFVSHFVVPHCSARYASLVALLPQVFVGPACQLEHVLDFVCREMAWSFKLMGAGLPPWRRKEAILSKFLPRVATDSKAFPRPLALPTQQLSPALHLLLNGQPRVLAEAAPAATVAVLQLSPLPNQPTVPVVKMRGQQAAPAPAAPVRPPWPVRCAAPLRPPHTAAAKGGQEIDTCLGCSLDSANASCGSFAAYGSSCSPTSVLDRAPLPFGPCLAGGKAPVGCSSACATKPVWDKQQRTTAVSLLTNQLKATAGSRRQLLCRA